MAKADQTNRPDDSPLIQASTVMSRRQLILTCIMFLLIALGVRLLVWQHYGSAAAQVMTGLTTPYKDDARILARGDVRLFVRGADPPSNANVLAHPPGYSILIATVFTLFGESDSTLRFFQVLCDAISVVLVFLIALELTSKRVALIAGALAALSPQLAYNSLLLLPDSLSVLPILMAVYLFIRSRNSSRRVGKLVLTGVLLGLSCWLRPNGLLLSLFMSAIIALVFKRGERLRSAVPLVGAAVLLIAPLTIRNLVVFHHFVPISLGTGLNLIEGIADYDNDVTFGLQKTDMELIQSEALLYNRPDYGGSFFTPDGIQRERDRVRRGVSVIRSHPFWFFGVMIQRAASMLRMERVPVISGSPLVVGADPQTIDHTTLQVSVLRFPAVILKSVQKLFITAVMLPLALIGLFLVVKRKETFALALLIVVPAYYLCVQSPLHTEYRYVLAIQYFFLVFVAVSVSSTATIVWQAAATQRRSIKNSLLP